MTLQLAWEGWLDPSVLVAAAALIGGVVVGTARLLRRRHERRKEQAGQVTMWVDRVVGGEVQVSVKNGSSQEITDVMVYVRRKHSVARVDELRAQNFSSSSIGPSRTVIFPLSISANPAGVQAYLVFKDAKGDGWSNVGGRLRPYNFRGFSTDLLGLGVVHRADGVVELEVTPTESGRDVPSHSFTVTSWREGQGHSVALVLVPDHVTVRAVATGEMRLDGRLVTTVDFDEDERVIRIANFRLTNPRAKIAPLRFEFLDLYDTLLCLMQAGTTDELMGRIKDIREIPALPDRQLGEVFLDEDGDLLLIRLLNASVSLHPAFWDQHQS